MKQRKKWAKWQQLQLFKEDTQISAPQAAVQSGLRFVSPYDENSPAIASPSPAGNEALIRNSSPGEQMQMALSLSVMYLEGTTEYHNYDKQGKIIIGNSN